MIKFPFAVWSKEKFPNIDKEETFFLENWTLQCS